MKTPEAISSRSTAFVLLLLGAMTANAPLSHAADSTGFNRLEAAARVDAEALRATANSARQGRYQESQHLAASTALTKLKGMIGRLPSEAPASDEAAEALLPLKSAISDALKTEDEFWNGLSEQVKSGDAASQAASDLASKIEAVVAILDKLSQESAALARPSGAPVALSQNLSDRAGLVAPESWTRATIPVPLPAA
jgi:hypothetical protein